MESQFFIFLILYYKDSLKTFLFLVFFSINLLVYPLGALKPIDSFLTIVRGHLNVIFFVNPIVSKITIAVPVLSETPCLLPTDVECI